MAAVAAEEVGVVAVVAGLVDVEPVVVVGEVEPVVVVADEEVEPVVVVADDEVEPVVVVAVVLVAPVVGVGVGEAVPAGQFALDAGAIRFVHCWWAKLALIVYVGGV